VTIRRPAGDDGSVLVLTLFFLITVGFIVTGLLNFSLTSLATTTSLLDQRRQVYAAEGGLYAAIQSVRGTANLGAENTACPTLTTAAAINGYATRVACAGQPGSGTTATNRPRYALLALPATGSLTEGVSDSPTNGAGGGNSKIYVGADVASNGVVERVANSSSGAFVIDGTAVARGACLGNNIQDLAGADVCTTTATAFTDPGLADPAGYGLAGGFPSSTDPAATCLTNAAKFVPGWYTAAPAAPAGCAAKPWWFSPGLYYFDFTGAGSHVWTLSGHTVVGGTPDTANYDPATGSAAPVMPGACRTEQDVPPYAGVQWVFGADTTLSVGSTGGIELCATPAATAQEIAVYGYGAAGATSTGLTTVTSNPATATGPASTFAPAVATQLIDATTALHTWTTASTRAATLTASSFADAPGTASIEKVVLRIKHSEASTTAVSTLAATLTLTGATVALTPVKGTALHEDAFDITSDVQQSGTALSAISVAYTATAAASQASSATLDGIALDVTYAPAGGFRRQAGCVVTPVTATSQCDTLATTTGSTLYLQGTVYAPLGRVDIVTDSGDTVALNRGVVARDIVAEIHPGNGSSHAFGLGRPDRLVLFTVSVQVNGVWVPRLESLVAVNDNDFAGGVHVTGRSLRIVSWRDLR
jgi:hypothetical protein